jgi:hypothetical protein
LSLSDAQILEGGGPSGSLLKLFNRRIFEGGGTISGGAMLTSGIAKDGDGMSEGNIDTSDIVGGLVNDGVKCSLTCGPGGNLFNFLSTWNFGPIRRDIAVDKLNCEGGPIGADVGIAGVRVSEDFEAEEEVFGSRNFENNK